MAEGSSQAQRIRQAADAIRPELPDLLGEQAPLVDAQLAELSAAADRGELVEPEILATLSRYDATRNRLRELLGPDWALTEKLAAPAGPGSPVTAPRFSCPLGDYTWSRREVGEPVPQCPTHNLPLMRG